MAEAQGVIFLCPKCGEHYVLLWFKDRGVPDELKPGPGRWTPIGSGIADLSLSPSVDLSKNEDGSPATGGCKWHGWVKDGEAS